MTVKQTDKMCKSKCTHLLLGFHHISTSMRKESTGQTGAAKHNRAHYT